MKILQIHQSFLNGEKKSNIKQLPKNESKKEESQNFQKLLEKSLQKYA